MKKLIPAFLALLVGGCTWPAADPKYFEKPEDRDSAWAAGHKTVWDEKHRIIGYIEIQDCNLADENLGEDAHLRESQRQSHRAFFVKDSENNMVGFISETGNTYRWKRASADYTHVGNYTIHDGIRTLLKTSATFELRSTRIED